jgi:hypothetical protein
MWSGEQNFFFDFFLLSPDHRGCMWSGGRNFFFSDFFFGFAATVGREFGDLKQLQLLLEEIKTRLKGKDLYKQKGKDWKQENYQKQI